MSENIVFWIFVTPFILWATSLLCAALIVVFANIKYKLLGQKSPAEIAKKAEHPATIEATKIEHHNSNEIEEDRRNLKNEGSPKPLAADKAPPIDRQEEDQVKKVKLLERKIIDGISHLQANEPELFLYALCFTFQLDVQKFKSPDLGLDLIASIYKGLNLDAQILGNGETITPQHPDVQRMLLAVLSGANGIIENAKYNFQVVFDYKPMLQSKLRTLSHTDAYGDPDYSDWNNFSSKFAIDKLKGITDLKLYMEISASTAERAKVARSGLADMYGHYVRAMLTLLIKLDAKDNSQTITGRDYENLLKQKIESRFKDAHVELTPATGDHGVDLLVDIKNTRFVLQAKYYKSNVGNAAVQEVFSGKSYYRADYAVVVCDSGYTKHAIELANNLDVLLCTTADFLLKMEMLLGESQ